MLFQKLIQIPKLMGKPYEGKEAIYYSVSPIAIFLRQVLARFEWVHGSAMTLRVREEDEDRV